MSRRRAEAGFTMIELIIAMSLSGVVLMGLFSIMTSMVQFEVEASRKGSVTAWSLASITVMNKDIASGSTLASPYPMGAMDDNLVVCTNWSRMMAPPNGAALSAAVGPAPTVLYYCYDAPAGVLRHMTGTGAAGSCPSIGAAPPPCSAGTYGPDNVVATGVYRDAAGDPIFMADPMTMNAVRLRYTVGNPNQGTVTAGNPGTVFANPQSLSFDTKILLEN